MTHEEKPCSVRECLQYVLSDYQTARDTYQTLTEDVPMHTFLTRVAPSCFDSIFNRADIHNETIRHKGSAGNSGNWAYIPWICALDSRITHSTQHGYFVGYLFAPYQNPPVAVLAFLIGIGQVTNEVNDNNEARTQIRKIADDIKSQIPEFREYFSDDLIDFQKGFRGVDENRPKNYEAACVFGRVYSNELPQDAILVADYSRMLGLYSACINRFGRISH